MICPNCGHDNIAGFDLCESCGSDLAGLDLPEARPGFPGHMMTDRVGDLDLAEPLFVSADTTVAEAIAKMREKRHGCVLVREDSRLVGIFTERDVLARVVRRGLDAAGVRVAEVMTPNPVTLSPRDPPAFAIHNTVARGLRHLPVVDGDRVLGFISVRHLLRYIHHDVIEREEKA